VGVGFVVALAVGIGIANAAQSNSTSASPTNTEVPAGKASLYSAEMSAAMQNAGVVPKPVVTNVSEGVPAPGVTFSSEGPARSGIIDSPEPPTSAGVFAVTNEYRVSTDGTTYSLYAGSIGSDAPGAGTSAVQLYVEDPGMQPVMTILQTSATGPLRITQASGTTVTMSDANSREFVFDLTERAFE